MPLGEADLHPLAILAAIVAIGSPAIAHVDYVPKSPSDAADPGLFFDVLAQPVNLALFAGGALALASLAVAWQSSDGLADVRVLADRLDDYERYVPWMLRLSLGLPLVGAGFAGFLYVPTIPTALRIPQVLVGFLLLLGLGTRLAALLGLAGWLATLATHGTSALLAGEYIGGFLALIVLGPGAPSADDMLARVAETPRTLYHRFDPVHRLSERLNDHTEPLERYAPALVRVPLGLTFAYLGIAEKIANPGPAIALAHELGLHGVLGLEAPVWVLGAGLVEVLVGACLVLGIFTRAASAAAFLVLTLTLFALSNDPVLPHVTLFGLASVVFTLGGGWGSVDEWVGGRPSGRKG